jgi:hypothetical protein
MKLPLLEICYAVMGAYLLWNTLILVPSWIRLLASERTHTLGFSFLLRTFYTLIGMIALRFLMTGEGDWSPRALRSADSFLAVVALVPFLWVVVEHALAASYRHRGLPENQPPAKPHVETTLRHVTEPYLHIAFAGLMVPNVFALLSLEGLKFEPSINTHGDVNVIPVCVAVALCAVALIWKGAAVYDSDERYMRRFYLAVLAMAGFVAIAWFYTLHHSTVVLVGAIAVQLWLLYTSEVALRTWESELDGHWLLGREKGASYATAAHARRVMIVCVLAAFLISVQLSGIVERS